MEKTDFLKLIKEINGKPLERKNEIELEGEQFLEELKQNHPEFKKNKPITLESFIPMIEKLPDRFICNCELCFQGKPHQIKLNRREKNQSQSQSQSIMWNQVSHQQPNSQQQETNNLQGNSTPIFSNKEIALQVSMAKIQPENEQLSILNQQSQQESDFYFIFKKLQPTTQKQFRYFKVYVRDIIFFHQGELKMIAFNNPKEKILKFSQQKEKLSILPVRKFLIEQQQQYQRMILNYINQMDDKLQNQAGAQSPQALSQTNQKEKTQNTQMNFNTEDDEIAVQETENNEQIESPKQLQQYKSQKSFPALQQILNQQQSNSNNGNIANIQQVSNLNSPTGNLEETKNKESVIIGFETVQQLANGQTKKINYQSILSDTEFFNFSMKRKLDPIWQSVNYIQSFLKPKLNPFMYQQITFDYEQESNNYLFLRAKNEIDIMLGEVTSVMTKFIKYQYEEEFEENLNKISKFTACQYIIYKFVNYIEQVHKIQIMSMTTEWLQDDLQHMVLSGIKNLKQQTIKSRYQFEFIAKKEIEKNFLNDPLENKYLAQERQRVEKILDDMRKQMLQKRNQQDIGQKYINKFMFAQEDEDFEQNRYQILQSKHPTENLEKYIIKKNLIEQRKKAETSQSKRTFSRTNLNSPKNNLNQLEEPQFQSMNFRLPSQTVSPINKLKFSIILNQKKSKEYVINIQPIVYKKLKDNPYFSYTNPHSTIVKKTIVNNKNALATTQYQRKKFLEN